MQNANPEKINKEDVSRERIRFPILAPLFAAIFILLITSGIVIYYLQETNINNDLHKRIENTNEFFNDELAEDARVLGAVIHLLKHDSKLQQLWLARDREGLLEYAAPVFEKLRNEYQITHLYFINVDKTTFLRVHNPKRFGDRIDRFTLLAAAHTEKPSWGIELGKYGTFTLRKVHPWFVNGELVGYIELGEEIEHITPRLKETLGADLVLLIDKSHLNRGDWEEGLKMMGRNGNWELIPQRIIADSTISEIPPKFLELTGLSDDRHEACFASATFGDSIYRAGCVPLTDAAGRKVGKILVIKNITEEEAQLRVLLAAITTLCLVVGAAMVSFFYIHITRIERHLIKARSALVKEIEKRKEAEAELRKNRDRLGEIVKSRTTELEETNERLRDEISDRNKIEEALRNSEQRFKQVAESAGDWIWEVDADGLYSYASPVAEKVIGYKPEEIIGQKYFYDFFSPEVKEAFKKAALDVFTKKETFSGFINPVIHKNGSTVVMETNGMPILDENGKLCGYRGADRDITERSKAQQRQTELLKKLGESNKSLQNENEQRTRAEKSLEATVTRLKQSNRQLREFAHLAAHDLRTPLRGIGTLAQWLAHDYYDKLDDEGREQFDLLTKRVERMDKIMDAILQYSTIAKNSNYERHTDLNVLLDKLLIELRLPRNITITVSNNLPVLICEQQYITQIFYNLLDNAVKFMDKPEGRITIDCTEEDEFWKFSVSDNGPGIEPQHFERIFKLFQTLDNRDKTERTGMGLSLVQKTVELYDGKIWLESKVGEGTTFFFTLPKQMTAVTSQAFQPTAT